MQTGDPTGTGSGGESHWGTPFRDEYDMRGAAKHDSRGIVAMANKGAGTNTSVCRFTFEFCFTDECHYRSQFYVTFRATPNLDNKHTVFGKLVGGDDVLDALEKLPRKDGTERPAKPVRITEIIMCARCFFPQTYIHIFFLLDIRIPLKHIRHGLQENLLGVQKHKMIPRNNLTRLKGMILIGLGSKSALGTRPLVGVLQVWEWASI